MLDSGGNFPVSCQCSCWIHLPRTLHVRSLGWMSWVEFQLQRLLEDRFPSSCLRICNPNLVCAPSLLRTLNCLECSGVFFFFFHQETTNLIFLIQRRRGGGRGECLIIVVHRKYVIMERNSSNVSLLDDFLTELCLICQENSGVEICVSESCIRD